VRVHVTLKGRDRFTERRTWAERGFLVARTWHFGRSNRWRHGRE
jgi:hypothetical protein